MIEELINWWLRMVAGNYVSLKQIDPKLISFN
jgi:hypothetical protein